MQRCGAVLPSINIRLDAAIIAVFPDHVVSRVVIADRDLKPFLQQALAQLAAPAIMDQRRLAARA